MRNSLSKTGEKTSGLTKEAAPQEKASESLISLPAQLRTQRILSAAALRDWLSKPKNLGFSNNLDNYFTAIQFIDPSITPENIANVINSATNENPDREIFPVFSSISKQITALFQLKESGETIPVVAINIGGTNSSATFAEVQNCTIKNQKDLGKAHFRSPENAEKPLKCTDHINFWEKTIPPEFLDKLKKLIADSPSPLAVEISLAAPTRNGYVEHLADKASFKKNPLAPQNETESEKIGQDRSKYPTLVGSFAGFLEKNGISLPSKFIFAGENDAINVVLGQPNETISQFKKLKGVGGVVVGTGFNVASFGPNGNGWNYEIGHLKLSNPCVLDEEVSSSAGLDLDLESCISGKILGDTLQQAIREITPKKSTLRKYIEGLSKDDANALIFNLGFGGEEKMDHLSIREKTILSAICSRFAIRAAQYLVAVLKGVSIEMGDISFFGEGSVLVNNPKLVKKINELLGEKLLTIPPQKNDLPPSAKGEIFDAASRTHWGI